MNISDPYFWNNYRQSASWFQDEILKTIEEELPELPFREQADRFRNAPKEVILRFFADLSWEAQIRVWQNYLPAGKETRLKAYSLLKEQAAIKLGLKKKKTRNVFC